MVKPSLRYNDANMRSTAAGPRGASRRKWTAMARRLRAAKQAVLDLMRTKEQGFLDLPFDRKANEACISLARRLSKTCTDLVVLGIGGSDLGARALHQALVRDPDKTRKGSMRLHFAGSSTDPDELAALLKRLDLKRTCVNVISKSGDTLETMAAFLVLRDRLMKTVGPKRMPGHIVATTDAEEGSLAALARKDRYETLTIPGNVGGRFSVLSTVGLFPAAAANVDTSALLDGARAYVESFRALPAGISPSGRYAGLHVIGLERRKQTIHVAMPYTVRLTGFARWVRQLEAESLGKGRTRAGKAARLAPTPVAAVGPEDQHSQLQLYAEGPADKLVTFIEVRDFEHAVRTPAALGAGETLECFGNRSFSDLIHLERRATAESLRQNGRPNGTITVESLDARAMGELFMFWEIAVALMGELMDVNAYDQPGVELSKQIMRQALK